MCLKNLTGLSERTAEDQTALTKQHKGILSVLTREQAISGSLATGNIILILFLYAVLINDICRTSCLKWLGIDGQFGLEVFFYRKLFIRNSIIRSLKSKTAFTRCRHILKTVKNSTDRPPVHTKTAHFLPADFENGRF